MLEEANAVKEIVKANATAVYQDAAQPSIRVVGKSLAQCVSLFASPVGRMAQIFEKNIHLYLDKLEGLKEEDLVSPDTRILVPILEKMRFTDEEKVADYYAEILATASKKEHASKVLITFIEILNRLTADEIKILEYINSPSNRVVIPEPTDAEIAQHGLEKGTRDVVITGSLPVMEIQRTVEGQTGYKVIAKNFNCLPEVVKLGASANLDAYIDNMISLGLIERQPNFVFAVDKIYHHLENNPRAIAIKDLIETDQKIKAKFQHGRIDITYLGKKLLSLCSRQN
ncbi:MAG: DUF4393 domain-containing protein [Candidatus Paceibacterota bacterium]|jgi:hypothetical protein